VLVNKTSGGYFGHPNFFEYFLAQIQKSPEAKRIRNQERTSVSSWGILLTTLRIPLSKMANPGQSCGSRRNFYICLDGAYFCRLGMFSFFTTLRLGEIITPQTTAASTNYPLVL